MTYSVEFSAGEADLPPGTSVTITAVSLQEVITLVDPNTVCTTLDSTNTEVSLSIPMSSAKPVTSHFLRKQIIWTCTFEVQVTDVHKAAGQIDSFDVTFSFTGGADVTTAYYVPTIQTQEVYVYTGNALRTPTYTMDDSDPDLFFTSE